MYVFFSHPQKGTKRRELLTQAGREREGRVGGLAQPTHTPLSSALCLDGRWRRPRVRLRELTEGSGTLSPTRPCTPRIYMTVH